MKTAQEWRCTLCSLSSFDGYIHIAEAWIEAVQADAARSERERAARVCSAKPDGRATDWCAGYDTACRHCAEDIRALPDAGADGREA